MSAIAAAATQAATGQPPEMHAPDGFLSVPVAAGMWLVTIVVLAIAIRRVDRTLDPRAVPMMGVAGAFIFAAQMFNFQVAGGTSGPCSAGCSPRSSSGPGRGRW